MKLEGVRKGDKGALYRKVGGYPKDVGEAQIAATGNPDAFCRIAALAAKHGLQLALLALAVVLKFSTLTMAKC